MLLILSLGFGLIAAVGISQVMGRNNGQATPTTAMGPVVVAVKQLEHNSLLNEENVRVDQWPLEIIPLTAATSIDQIKDMASRAPLSPGLPVILDNLVHKTEIDNIVIPDGYKVVAIKVDEDDTFAGLLKPGDKVDVIGNFRTKDRSETFAKTFLKAIRVWSVNADMVAQAGSRSETSIRGSAIVGVLVNERQAEAIVHVQKTGSLKLILRGDHVAGDDEDLSKLLELGFPFQSLGSEEASMDNQATSQMPAFVAGSSPYDNLSMIVWNGNEPQKTVFKNGSLPDHYYRSGSNSSDTNQAAPAKSDDYASSSEIEDRDRGLEEDQYQGE